MSTPPALSLLMDSGHHDQQESWPICDLAGKVSELGVISQRDDVYERLWRLVVKTPAR